MPRSRKIFNLLRGDGVKHEYPPYKHHVNEFHEEADTEHFRIMSSSILEDNLVAFGTRKHFRYIHILSICQ